MGGDIEMSGSPGARDVAHLDNGSFYDHRTQYSPGRLSTVLLLGLRHDVTAPVRAHRVIVTFHGGVMSA